MGKEAPRPEQFKNQADFEAAQIDFIRNDPDQNASARRAEESIRESRKRTKR